MKKTLLIFAAAFACFESTKIKAQESLSLGQAVEKGLANNFDILIEKKNSERAALLNNAGEAGKLPRIDLGLGQNNLLNNNNNPTAFVTGNIFTNSITPTLAASWTLFDGYRVRYNKDRLQLLEEETQGNADIVVQNALQAIVMAYYKCVLDQESIKAVSKSMELSRDRWEYVKTRKEMGASGTAESLLAESAYLTDSIGFINQQLAYRNSVRHLNLQMSEGEIDKTYIFSNPLEIHAEEFSLPDLIAAMEKENKDLAKLYISQAILHNAVYLQKASLYPTARANANFSFNGQRQDLSQARFLDGRPRGAVSSTNTNAGIGFTVAYTLFDGGKIKNAIKATEMQESAGDLRIEKMKLSLERDLAGTLDAYNARKQLKDVSRRNLEAATLNLSLSKERWEAGAISSFDFRNVQNNYLNAAFNEYLATYNLIDSNIALMRLTGGLLAKYGAEAKK